jgi:hypothetical protein
MPTRFNIGTTEWTMVKKEEKRREEKRRESGRKISCYKELRNSLRKLHKARKGAANFTIHVGNVDNSFFPYLGIQFRKERPCGRTSPTTLEFLRRISNSHMTASLVYKKGHIGTKIF